MFTMQQLQQMFKEELQVAENICTQRFVAQRGAEWRLELNGRVTAVGLCDYRKKVVSLSKHYLDRDEAYIRNTMKHEIAHALCPGEGHGTVWRLVFLALGGDGERTAKDVTNRPDSAIKWKVIHKDTGEVFAKYSRKPTRDFSCCFVKGDRSTMGKLIVVPA